MSGMTSSLNSHRTHSVSSLPCAAACDGGRPPADTQPHSVGKPCRNHLKQAPKPAIAVACSWSCFLSGQLQSSTVHFPEVSQLRGLLGGVLRGVAGGGGIAQRVAEGVAHRAADKERKVWQQPQRQNKHSVKHLAAHKSQHD